MTRMILPAGLGIGLLLCSLGAAAEAGAHVERFYGYAYDLNSDRYIYTEVHEQHWQDGREQTATIRYVDPEGNTLGKKFLDYRQDYFVPVYELSLPDLDYEEGIRAAGEDIEMFMRDGDRQKRKSIDKPESVTADSGFHHYLQAHFEELMAGETIKFTFVAAGNLGDYSFRAKRIDDSEFEGKPAVRFKVEAASLLRLVAPKLILSYDPDSQRLLEYRGPSNIQNPETGKVYDARIAFYSTAPSGVGKLPPLDTEQ